MVDMERFSQDEQRRFDRMLVGDVRRECIDGHVIDTMRIRGDVFSVRCTTCRVVVHPSTTGPAFNVRFHIRNPDDSAWPEVGSCEDDEA